MAKKGIITAALLVTAAGAGFAGYRYLHGESQPVDLASVIPADAYFAAYISNEPAAWTKLQKFGTPAAQKVISQQLTELQQKFLADTKMDYAKDLQPWMGNVMVAALPDANGKTTEPQVLVAIGVKDKLKALDFANKVKAQSKEPSKEIDYKGVKITDTGKGKNETFSALVNDELVISPQQHSLELAIDTAKGSPSLASKASNDWFKGDTLQLKQPIMAFYVPDFTQFVQQSLKYGKTPMPIDSATLVEMKKIQSIGCGIAIDDAGIRLKSVTKTDGTTLTLPTFAAKSISNFPDDTFAIAGGTGIAQIWTEINRLYSTNPSTKASMAQLRQEFTKSTQLDLDKDVFGWMGGEYSLGLIPVTGGITAAAGFGGALSIESTDKATTDNTMTKLTNMAKGYGLQAEQRQLEGKTVTDIKIPGQGAILSYGWLNDKSMLLAIGDGSIDKIAKPAGETLDRSANYATILSTMPQDKQSYFYLDVEKVSALFGSKLAAVSGKPMPADVDAVVSSIRGIGMTSVQTDKATNKFEALLALKAAN
jgi:hypothetical protein